MARRWENVTVPSSKPKGTPYRWRLKENNRSKSHGCEGAIEKPLSPCAWNLADKDRNWPIDPSVIDEVLQEFVGRENGLKRLRDLDSASNAVVEKFENAPKYRKLEAAKCAIKRNFNSEITEGTANASMLDVGKAFHIAYHLDLMKDEHSTYIDIAYNTTCIQIRTHTHTIVVCYW